MTITTNQLLKTSSHAVSDLVVHLLYNMEFVSPLGGPLAIAVFLLLAGKTHSCSNQLGLIEKRSAARQYNSPRTWRLFFSEETQERQHSDTGQSMRNEGNRKVSICCVIWELNDQSVLHRRRFSTAKYALLSDTSSYTALQKKQRQTLPWWIQKSWTLYF